MHKRFLSDGSIQYSKYDPEGRLRIIILADPDNNVQSTSYLDVNGRLARVKMPDGMIQDFTYSPENYINLITVTHPDGRITRHMLDPQGNVIKHIFDDGSET